MEEDLPDGGGSDCSSSGGEYNYYGGALSGAGLAQTILDTHTANELGLVRSEVKRLRAKVEQLEREKDMMVDDFNVTTQMLLDRIRVLETEKSGTDSRPQTAAILDRVDATWGKKLASQRSTHEPEVLRIEEEDPAEVDSPPKPPSTQNAADAAAEDASCGECKRCGNCGQQILATNFTTHSVYCYRNNFHCDACKKILPVSEKETHTAWWTDSQRLVDAAKEHDVEQVQLMCAHGADFQLAVHPTSADTVLHVAARNSDLALVELCMGYGVDVDPMNSEGETPLHLAASKAEMPIVKLLVELGATLNISNGNGETPLMLVCRRGHAETARYLVDKKADAEAKTRLGDTPLQIAQRLGFQETVLALSMAGATLRPGTPQRIRARSGSRPRSGSPKPLSRESGYAPTRIPSGGSGLGGGAGYPPLPPTSHPGGRRP